MTQPAQQSTMADLSPERMRLLLHGATQISQTLDPREVAESALQLVFKAVDLTAGLILIFPGEQRIILTHTGFSADTLRRFQSPTLNLQETIFGQILESGNIDVVPDLSQIPRDDVVDVFQQAELQRLVFVPLQIPGNMPGVMLLSDQQIGSLTGDDIAFLEAIAEQIGIGLRNAWLFAQSQRQLKEVKSIAEAAQTVVSSLDSNQILTQIMQEVTTRLNTEAAALLLLDTIREELEFAAVAGPKSAGLKGVRLPMGHGIVGWVAQHNEPLLVPDVTRDERFFQGLDKQTDTVSQAILCVPLRVRGELIGVVEVINKKRGTFSRADQRLLESLASFAAVAIENARYYEESNKQMEQATLYARDLTIAFKRERKQRESLDRLRYSFLNVVSHELKTPLTVIMQGLETIKNPRRGELNKEQADIVNMLDQQSSYLGRLIDGLVAFATFSARQGTMKFKPVAFELVLEEVLALALFKARRKQITLDEQRQSQLPTLSIDKERMSEAIGHLLDNALKFSAEETHITIETFADTDVLTIQITDQGRGIPEDQIQSIWDGFTQMNSTMERGLEGLGLGLAIARYIVEAHNGDISVKSRVDQGSTFTIHLPIAG